MADETATERHEFVIHVDKVVEKWDVPEVLASKIMKEAGTSDVDTHVLEALDGPHGKVVMEFKADQIVDLRQNDRRFFHVTAGGGGYS